MAESLNVEILTFGNELLDGRRIDSNTAWLGRRFSGLGVPPRFRQSAKDNVSDIAHAFKTALARSDIIVTTGGLGPTLDDLTFESLALALGQPLTFREEIWKTIQQRFASRGIRCSENNKRQAWLPEKALALNNDRGTAPGLHVEVGAKQIFCMPGVPAEMEFIFENSILPVLKKLIPGKNISYELGYYFSGIPESHLEEEIEKTGIRTYPYADVQIAYTASFPRIDLTLSVSPHQGKTIDQVRHDLENMIFARLESHFLSRSHESLEENIIRCFTNRVWKLGIAESLTGGLLAGQLINVAGSSKVIDVAVTAYDNRIKQNLLGVSSATLEKYGAVSKECALEMARGMCTKFGASVGISTTGIAGPEGGSREKPVGLTYIAVCGPVFEKEDLRDGVVKEFRFQWDRNRNRSITVYEALKMLWKNLPQGNS